MREFSYCNRRMSWHADTTGGARSGNLLDIVGWGRGQQPGKTLPGRLPQVMAGDP